MTATRDIAADVPGVETGPFPALFEAARDRLPGHGRPELDDIRARALAQFAAAGLPGRKVEAWKFTPLNDLKNAPLSLPEPAALTATDLPPALPGGCRLVFVNGLLDSGLSDLGDLPDGVRLRRLEDLLADDAPAAAALLSPPRADNPMLALNAALAGEAVAIEVAAGAMVATPLELLFLNRGGENGPAAHLRHRLTLGAGATLDLLERHGGDGRYVTSIATDVTLDDNARLRHFRLQDDSVEAQHFSFLHVTAGRDARYRSFVLTTGAARSRNEIHVALAAENAEAQLDGAYLLAGRQHGDTTTVLDHVSPHTRSTETYRGVVDERAHGVFQGRIAIARDAQHTEGHQLSKALLLSDTAAVDTKPELEIFADDVQCSHGATAGELDDDQLFYLQARGLDEAEARALLIEAFVTGLVEEIENEAVRALFLERIAGWLKERA